MPRKKLKPIKMYIYPYNNKFNEEDVENVFVGDTFGGDDEEDDGKIDKSKFSKDNFDDIEDIGSKFTTNTKASSKKRDMLKKKRDRKKNIEYEEENENENIKSVNIDF